MGLIKRESKMVWRDKHGNISCPGDKCPVNCDDSCPIWINTIGMSLLQIKQYDRAIETYKQGIEIAPDFADLWNNMAACYANINDYYSAYEAFKKAYELAGRKSALYGLALASRDCGKIDEAIAYCREYSSRYDDGVLDSVERELLNKRTNVDSAELYLAMLKEFLEYANKNGYVTYKGVVPIIPEIGGQADVVCNKILRDLKAYLDSEYGEYEFMKLYDFTSNWCLYAGMGAVWHWNTDWDTLKTKGIVNTLSEPEGIDCIDDVVLDCVGIGRESDTGMELRSFVSAMSMLALTVASEEMMKDVNYIMRALIERNKAMYLLGIAIEMHRLGMN